MQHFFALTLFYSFLTSKNFKKLNFVALTYLQFCAMWMI